MQWLPSTKKMDSKPTFQLINILLIESTFKREVTFDIDNISKAQNILDVNSQSMPASGDDFGVFLTITFKQILNKITILETKVTMVGSFKKNESVDEIALAQFCNVNAPAIIFPFIRETIASMTLKAGVNPVLIQPLNFVELAKKAPKEAVGKKVQA